MTTERITWGRAFGFSAIAVGVPWAICQAIAEALAWLSSGSVGPAATFMALGPAGAGAGIIIGGLIAHTWPPRSRGVAAGQTVLACVLAIAAMVVAIVGVSAVVDGDAAVLYFGLLAFAIGAGVFLVGGGAVWAAAGGIAAARILPGTRPRLSRWLSIGWIALGALAAVGSVLYAATDPDPGVSDFGAVAVRDRWQWFPFGWGWERDGLPSGPGWTPMLAFANALGLVAIGIAMGLRPRTEERVGPLPENRLIP